MSIISSSWSWSPRPSEREYPAEACDPRRIDGSPLLEVGPRRERQRPRRHRVERVQDLDARAELRRAADREVAGEAEIEQIADRPFRAAVFLEPERHRAGRGNAGKDVGSRALDSAIRRETTRGVDLEREFVAPGQFHLPLPRLVLRVVVLVRVGDDRVEK